MQRPSFASTPRLGMTFVTLLALLAFSSRTVPAAEFDKAKLAALKPALHKFIDEKQLAGVVAAVGNSAGLVQVETAGWRNVEKQSAMTEDALFRIASMTKPIVAMTVMMLQDEGKLSVEDPVEKHLPEFKGQLLVASKSADQLVLKKPSRPITIRDLLTHTSGLPGGYPPGLADLYFTRRYNLAEATLVASQQPLQFEPGSKWAYCNAGIDTLGRIVEVLSGQPYEKFLAERIAQPLGLKDTSFYPTSEQLERLAGLYESKEKSLKYAGFVLLGPTQGSRHPIPAGGLYSTAADLAKIYQMMLNRGQGPNGRILSEAAVKQMTSLQTGDLECGFTPQSGFGFGFAVTKQPEGVHAMLSKGSYGHGGAFGTQGWIDPDKGFFVILLIQRVSTPGGDASEFRRVLQQTAVDAIK
jgi:CubicO group peptidase (beta-lactamase class C family)